MNRTAPKTYQIEIRIKFIDLQEYNGTFVKEITMPSKADFDKLTIRFAEEIEKVLGPEYLRCLLRWRSEIGTSGGDLEPAQESKTLSDYVSAKGGTIVARITAGLIMPTLRNLRSAQPAMLTRIPSVVQFNGWMDEIIQEAKEPLGGRIKPMDLATAKESGEWYEWERKEWRNAVNEESKDLQLAKAMKYCETFDKLVEKAIAGSR